jgi:hypothetical protein
MSYMQMIKMLGLTLLRTRKIQILDQKQRVHLCHHVWKTEGRAEVAARTGARPAIGLETEAALLVGAAPTLDPRAAAQQKTQLGLGVWPKMVASCVAQDGQNRSQEAPRLGAQEAGRAGQSHLAWSDRQGRVMRGRATRGCRQQEAHHLE